MFKVELQNWEGREIFMKKTNNPLIIMPFNGVGGPEGIPPNPPKF